MLLQLKKLIHTALSLIFPWYCAGCKKRGELLCLECKEKLNPELQPIDQTEEIWSIFNYKNQTISQLIWYLKYKHITKVAEIFSPYLTEVIMDLVADDIEISSYVSNEKILLLPVPMWPGEKRRRGSNHAEHLVTEIVKEIPFTTKNTKLIHKNKKTKTQVDCRSKKERRGNIKNSFSVTDPEKIRDKVIIIIDDVATTGATAREIIKIVKTYKPKKVIALTLAHG